MQFQIGDRVELISEFAGGESGILPIGAIGTVVDIESSYPPIGVRWEESFGAGHECGGTCEMDHGWYVYSDEIMPLQEDLGEDSQIDISAML